MWSKGFVWNLIIIYSVSANDDIRRTKLSRFRNKRIQLRELQQRLSQQSHGVGNIELNNLASNGMPVRNIVGDGNLDSLGTRSVDESTQTQKSARGSGGVARSNEPQAGYDGVNKLRTQQPVKSSGGSANQPFSTAANGGAQNDENLPAEFGPLTTVLPRKKPLFQCSEHPLGMQAQITEFSPIYYNKMSGSVTGRNQLNCDQRNRQCCWNNAPFPRDQYQFQSINNWQSIGMDEWNHHFGSDSSPPNTPNTDLLIVNSGCQPQANGSAEFVSCTLGLTEGDVTVKLRHWVTEGASMKVCKRAAFTQFTARTPLTDCVNVANGQGSLQSIKIPGGRLFDIVLVATNFSGHAGGVAAFSDLSVDYVLAPELNWDDKVTTSTQTPPPVTLRPIFTQKPEWFEDARLLTLTLKNFEYKDEYADLNSPEHLQLKKDVEAMLSASLLEIESLDSLIDEGWTGKYRYVKQELCTDPWSTFILDMKPGSTVMQMKLQPPAGVINMSKQTSALNGISSQPNRRRRRYVKNSINETSSVTSKNKRETCGYKPSPYEELDVSTEDAIELLSRNGPPYTLKYDAFEDFCSYLEPRFEAECAEEYLIADCNLDFCTAYAHRCELIAIEQIPWLVDPCKPNEAEQPGDPVECLIGCDFEGGLGSCAYRLEAPIVNHTQGTAPPSGFAQTRVIKRKPPKSSRRGRQTRSGLSRSTVILRAFMTESSSYVPATSTTIRRNFLDLQYDPLHGQRGVNKALKGTVLNVPFMNRAYITAEGSYYGAMYVMPNKSVIIDLNTELKTTRLISFKYYAATHGVLFKACCSENVCPFTSSFHVGHFRRWQTAKLICPKGSNKIHFECHATSRVQGACGIDAIRLNYYDPVLVTSFGGLRNYTLQNACE